MAVTVVEWKPPKAPTSPTQPVKPPEPKQQPSTTSSGTVEQEQKPPEPKPPINPQEYTRKAFGIEPGVGAVKEIKPYTSGGMVQGVYYGTPQEYGKETGSKVTYHPPAGTVSQPTGQTYVTSQQEYSYYTPKPKEPTPYMAGKYPQPVSSAVDKGGKPISTQYTTGYQAGQQYEPVKEISPYEYQKPFINLESRKATDIGGYPVSSRYNVQSTIKEAYKNVQPATDGSAEFRKTIVQYSPFIARTLSYGQKLAEKAEMFEPARQGKLAAELGLKEYSKQFLIGTGIPQYLYSVGKTVRQIPKYVSSFKELGTLYINPKNTTQLYKTKEVISSALSTRDVATESEALKGTGTLVALSVIPQAILAPAFAYQTYKSIKGYSRATPQEEVKSFGAVTSNILFTATTAKGLKEPYNFIKNELYLWDLNEKLRGQIITTETLNKVRDVIPTTKAVSVEIRGRPVISMVGASKAEAISGKVFTNEVLQFNLGKIQTVDVNKVPDFIKIEGTKYTRTEVPRIVSTKVSQATDLIIGKEVSKIKPFIERIEPVQKIIKPNQFNQIFSSDVVQYSKFNNFISQATVKANEMKLSRQNIQLSNAPDFLRRQLINAKVTSGKFEYFQPKSNAGTRKRLFQDIPQLEGQPRLTGKPIPKQVEGYFGKAYAVETVSGLEPRYGLFVYSKAKIPLKSVIIPKGYTPELKKAAAGFNWFTNNPATIKVSNQNREEQLFSNLKVYPLPETIIKNEPYLQGRAFLDTKEAFVNFNLQSSMFKNVAVHENIHLRDIFIRPDIDVRKSIKQADYSNWVLTGGTYPKEIIPDYISRSIKTVGIPKTEESLERIRWGYGATFYSSEFLASYGGDFYKEILSKPKGKTEKILNRLFNIEPKYKSNREPIYFYPEFPLKVIPKQEERKFKFMSTWQTAPSETKQSPSITPTSGAQVLITEKVKLNKKPEQVTITKLAQKQKQRKTFSELLGTKVRQSQYFSYQNEYVYQPRQVSDIFTGTTLKGAQVTSSQLVPALSARLITPQVSVSLTGQNQAQRLKQVQLVRQENLTKLISIYNQKTVQEQKQQLETKQVQAQGVLLSTVPMQAVKTVQAQQQIQVQAQKVKQLLKQKYKTQSQFINVPKTKEYGYSKPEDQLTVKKTKLSSLKKRKAYLVFIKKKQLKLGKGRYKSLGYALASQTPLTYESAKGFGIELTKASARRSFQLQPVEGEPLSVPRLEALSQLSYQYRQSKINPNVIVQKSKYAISTAGEKREIRRKKVKFI